MSRGSRRRAAIGRQPDRTRPSDWQWPDYRRACREAGIAATREGFSLWRRVRLRLDRDLWWEDVMRRARDMYRESLRA